MYLTVESFKYLGYLLTNQHYIHEEIKCRLKSGISCYYSLQALLFSRLLSMNFKIKIYKTITLPFGLYSYETWSLTLMEERRLRVVTLREEFSPASRIETGSLRAGVLTT